MKSFASIKGHPIHPILITFPIAFFFGTFFFDAISIFYNEEGFWPVGAYLTVAGIVTGVLAGIPGFLDYLKTVPPKSSGKKRAAIHGVLNVTIILIFTVTFLIRAGRETGSYVILMVEGLAILLLSISGWLGGTLVYKNQIAVNNRYADGGKWSDLQISETIDKIEVAKVNELKKNQMKLITVNGQRIVLALSEHGYMAFDDRCTHKGGSLAGGTLICSTVQCPWHGSQFKIQNGEIAAGPAKEKIKTYKVVQEGEKVFLLL